MRFTVKTDDFRRSVIRAMVTSVKAGSPLDKLRMEVGEDFCTLICTDGTTTIRTGLKIYDSDVPIGTTLIINDFSKLLKMSQYLFWVLTTLTVNIEEGTMEIQAEEKKFMVRLSDDSEFGEFPDCKVETDVFLFDVNSLSRRYKKIKYAVDKNSPRFSSIYFVDSCMYATDSKRIAVSRNEVYKTPFSFGLRVSDIELICRTLGKFLEIRKSGRYVFFKDTLGTEVACVAGEDAKMDFAKILKRKYTGEATTNARLFADSLEFLRAYVQTSTKPVPIAWRGSRIRLTEFQDLIETKIPISQEFDFTITFNLNILLGCLQQFKNNDIILKYSDQMGAVSISCNDDECVIMPMKGTKDPFAPTEEELDKKKGGA